jgi:hypothetical protein
LSMLSLPLPTRAITVPLIRVKTSEPRCSYTTVATFVGLPSGSSHQTSNLCVNASVRAACIGDGASSTECLRRPSCVSAVARIEPLYRHFQMIISVQIPRPMGSIALVATLLVWWCAGVGVPMNTARADDCLTAPNSPAPAGSHWYFRTDRAKQRNCWYLHAPDQPPQPATAQAISDAPPATRTIAFKKPPTASPSDPKSTSPGDSAAPLLPPVKPAQGAPMSSATPDQPVRQSAQKGSSATSIPDAPAPQASPSSSTQGAGPAQCGPIPLRLLRSRRRSPLQFRVNPFALQRTLGHPTMRRALLDVDRRPTPLERRPLLQHDRRN